MNGYRNLHRLTLLCLCFYLQSVSYAQNRSVPNCGSLSNGIGPYDYRTEARPNIDVVERYHFNSDVESLTRGQSSAYLIADLDYTLRAIPNHRRALAAVAKYQLSGGKFDVVEINGADCYFLRALAFTPTDAAVRLIYGNYLYKSKELQKAEEMYTSALALDPGSAEIAYNAGLYYVTKGDVAKAEGMAKIAYDQGYPLPGLRNRINALKQSQASPKAAVKR